MAFSLIRADSRQWLEQADGTAADADRAVAALRGDYERWSRWGLGVLAFAGFTIGVIFTVGMIVAVAEFGGPPMIIDMTVVALGFAVTVASIFLLVRLWQTGRALTHAAARWMRVPYRNGARQRRATGWVTSRTINFEAPVLLRITTATLAFLLAIAAIAIAVRDIVESAFGSFGFMAAVVGVAALLCGLGQSGGIMRLVSGASEADPLWARIRASMTRD